MTSPDARPIHCADTCYGRIIGLALLCYGAFSVYLYAKFTPVYTATECAAQAATLDKLDLVESSIHMGLGLEVTCWNPNPYSIDIMSTQEGEVFVGQTERVSVGKLRVLPGSVLPEAGRGSMQISMDAVLAGSDGEHLLPEFLEDREVDLMLNLNFNFGIKLSFGMISSWETTVPFQKACGLKVAGILWSGSGGRLGPLACADSFDSLVIPPVTAPKPSDGGISLSAAQMDPERFQMGERIKNVSIINAVLVCYGLGLWLLRTWFLETCCNVRDAVMQRRLLLQTSQDEAEERTALSGLVFSMIQHSSRGPGAARSDYAAGQLLQVDEGKEADQNPPSTLESFATFFKCYHSKRPSGAAKTAPEPPQLPRAGLYTV